MCQRLTDYIIFRTNTMAAEPKVPPAFKCFLCGFNLAATAQWLTVLAVYHDNLVANDNTVARQKQHWFTHNSVKPWSQHVYMEVCARVARWSGDICTSRLSVHACPCSECATLHVLSLQFQWLMSAIYCNVEQVNGLRHLGKCRSVVFCIMTICIECHGKLLFFFSFFQVYRRSSYSGWPLKHLSSDYGNGEQGVYLGFGLKSGDCDSQQHIAFIVS